MNSDGRLPEGADNDHNAPYNEETEVLRKVEYSMCIDGTFSCYAPKDMSTELFHQMVRDKLESILNKNKVTLTDIWMQEI